MMRMRYLSLFSGIEAASVAWEPLGWEPVAFCEIDAFPSAVLAYRFPNVPNLGDITKVDWHEFKERHGTVDVIVGGSPCQSFSIAGGRASLGGESRLMFEFIRALDEVRPTWFVWENVPGVLNTRDDAFAQLLREVQDIGYGSLAWRVLDAQFFGVAQRRRRVFLVGHVGNGSYSAAVLFDSESVSGNTQSSREKRESLTGSATFGAGGFKYHQGADAGGIGYEPEQSPTLTAGYHNPAVIALQSDADGYRNGSGWQDDGSAYTLNTIERQSVLCMAGDTSKAAVDDDVAGTLLAGGGSPPMIAVGQSAQGLTRGHVQTTCKLES